jgi:NAD(P)-dependent dehydrogenase (short-subunit alcohol dehydrogenase family)
LGHLVASSLVQLGGWRVFAAARSWQSGHEAAATRLSALAAAARGGGASGSAVELVTLDVASATSRAAAVDAIAASGCKLSAVLNNAAIYPDEWDAATFESCLDTNTRGPVALTAALIERGLLEKGAHVVNVSSGLGKLDGLSARYRQLVTECSAVSQLDRLPFLADDTQRSLYAAPYRVSKAAINRATQLFAAQYEGQFRFSSVDPGWCRTDMGGASAPRSADAGATSLLLQ